MYRISLMIIKFLAISHDFLAFETSGAMSNGLLTAAELGEAEGKMVEKSFYVETNTTLVLSHRYKRT